MDRKVGIGKWKGGRMFANKNGRPIYILAKMSTKRNYMSSSLGL